MICYCGKPTWQYDELTLTCKAGHHSPVPGGAVATFLPDPSPPRFTIGPRLAGALSGAGTSLLLFALERLF